MGDGGHQVLVGVRASERRGRWRREITNGSEYDKGG